MSIRAPAASTLATCDASRRSSVRVSAAWSSMSLTCERVTASLGDSVCSCSVWTAASARRSHTSAGLPRRGIGARAPGGRVLGSVIAPTATFTPYTSAATPSPTGSAGRKPTDAATIAPAMPPLTPPAT